MRNCVTLGLFLDYEEPLQPLRVVPRVGPNVLGCWQNRCLAYRRCRLLPRMASSRVPTQEPNQGEQLHTTGLRLVGVTISTKAPDKMDNT